MKSYFKANLVVFMRALSTNSRPIFDECDKSSDFQHADQFEDAATKGFCLILAYLRLSKPICISLYPPFALMPFAADVRIGAGSDAESSHLSLSDQCYQMVRALQVLVHLDSLARLLAPQQSLWELTYVLSEGRQKKACLAKALL